MTYLEIDQALIQITRQKCEECNKRLDEIPKENTTERKAVQIEYGMYAFCGNAGLLFNGSGKREFWITKRQRFLNNRLRTYPKLYDIYQALNDEEKMCFLAALQAELFIRDQWLGAQIAELRGAEASGDVKRAFEFRIKIEAVETMFAGWEMWRKENNVYPRMFEEVEE